MVRVLNSDIRNGKRSGYTIVYLLKTHANIILVTIYSGGGSGGYFGMADSAHSDPGLTGMPDSRKCAETMEIAQDVARKLIESYIEHGFTF